jgi:hypothetical protein
MPAGRELEETSDSRPEPGAGKGGEGAGFRSGGGFRGLPAAFLDGLVGDRASVYYRADGASILDPRAVLRRSGRGCDASNLWDEEVVDAAHMDYSDDEQERAARQGRRKGRSQRHEDENERQHENDRGPPQQPHNEPQSFGVPQHQQEEPRHGHPHSSWSHALRSQPLQDERAGQQERRDGDGRFVPSGFASGNGQTRGHQAYHWPPSSGSAPHAPQFAAPPYGSLHYYPQAAPAQTGFYSHAAQLTSGYALHPASSYPLPYPGSTARAYPGHLQHPAVPPQSRPPEEDESDTIYYDYS